MALLDNPDRLLGGGRLGFLGGCFGVRSDFGRGLIRGSLDDGLGGDVGGGLSSGLASTTGSDGESEGQSGDESEELGKHLILRSP